MKRYLRGISKAQKGILLYCFVGLIVAFLFYNSIIPAFIFMLGLKPYYKKISEKERIHRINMKKQEFACVLDSMASSMSAGYSLQNAFREAQLDIKKMYGTGCSMYGELMEINNQISVNRNIDDVLDKYASKCEFQEGQYFCEVITITRREGGNIIKIIKEVRDIIYEKMELDRQIQIITASKRSEAMVMAVMPIGIMAYLRLVSPELLDGMYGSVLGVVIMTVILVMYAGIVIYMDRIGRIEI